MNQESTGDSANAMRHSMGVAGCGKSTVAEAIRDRLSYEMAEGDAFHPQANIDKMSAGIPLTDEDRWPWLRVINSWMAAKETIHENTVVSSSALKRAYRDVLRENVPVFFVMSQESKSRSKYRSKTWWIAQYKRLSNMPRPRNAHSPQPPPELLQRHRRTVTDILISVLAKQFASQFSIQRRI